MAVVALLRGANLGKRRFSPKALVEQLGDLDVTNIGAAGTFVVRKRVAERALRARMQDALPWEDAEMVVLAEKEVRDAMEVGRDVAVPAGARRFGLALPAAPARAPALPVEAKATDGAWAMRYVALAGRVVVGVRRPLTGKYSTRPLDAAVGTDRGTLRDWPTWEKIADALDG